MSFHIARRVPLLKTVAASVPARPRRGFASSLWATYNNSLAENPLLTKAITSGLICCVSDVSCQGLQAVAVDANDRLAFDPLRNLRFTFAGTFLLAPSLHVWYSKLASWIPGNSMVCVGKRLVLDQLVFAPAFIPTFMSFLMVLEGNAREIPGRLKAAWFETVASNWVIWVPAQILNFRLIPVTYQVLFSNVVGLGWNIILSFQTSKPIEKTA